MREEPQPQGLGVSVPSPHQEPDREFRVAALLMVASGLMFTIMVSFVKVARQELDPLPIMLWRSLIALPIALMWSGGFKRVVPQALPWLGLRSLLGFGAMFGFYYASEGIGVGELGFVAKLQPVLLAVFAPWVLGRSERVPKQIWGLIALSFFGVGVLMWPKMQGSAGWGDLFSSHGSLAICACACSAIAHLCVRRLGAWVSAPSIVLYFQSFVGIVAALVLAGQGRLTMPESRWIPILLAVGLTSTAGQLFLTKAYAKAKAARIAAMSYVSPIWGVLIDALCFGVLPGPEIWLGGALIMAGGLGLLRAKQRG